MLGEKIYLNHNSERTSPGMPISGSILYWNPASKVEQNATSLFPLVCMQCLSQTGKLSLLPHQQVIWPVHWTAPSPHTHTHTHTHTHKRGYTLFSNSLYSLTLPWYLWFAFCGISYRLSISCNWKKSTVSWLNTLLSLCTWAIRELQEHGSLTTVQQDSLHEQCLSPSSCHDLCEFHQPPNMPAFLSEEYMVHTPLAVSGEHPHCKENKAPNGLPCSLPILHLSLLSVRQLSLPQVLLLHLGFRQTLGFSFKHRH
jgi:hypothetical protein